MSKKTRAIISIYAAAALVTLSVLSSILYTRLNDYRRTAAFSSKEAFEETVKAVDTLSASLKKSVYASDGGMCASICADAYSSALAAEAALSILPFSTQELEQTSAFINTAGDYAFTLCAAAAKEGFTDEQVEQLTKFSETAADYASMLRELQGSVHNGLTIIDQMEEPLQNVEQDSTQKLSATMLDYEAGLPKAQGLSYDGKYSEKQQKAEGELSEEEILNIAAQAAGVEARELKQQYEYEGTDSRRCYSAGELLICVSARGFESMSHSRQVGEGTISVEDAAKTAEDFLKKLGYEGLSQVSENESNGTVCFHYARTEEDAVSLDNYVTISIALDDGSVYMVDATRYEPDSPQLQWTVDEEKAREKLTDNLELQSQRKVVIKSAGGRDQPCYEFSCTGLDGESVRVYVSAETGEQCKIVL